MFVSIHFNSSSDGSANGTESWYDPAKSSSQTLADDLLDVTRAGFSLRGTRRSGIDCPWCNGKTIYVLHHTKMSGGLAEVAFLSNINDENTMHSVTLTIPVIAFYMSQAIDEFLNQ